MIIYLITDEIKQTYSFPLVADNVEQVVQALNELKPENREDLKIHVIEFFDNAQDLLSLKISRPNQEEHNKKISSMTALINILFKKD